MCGEHLPPMPLMLPTMGSSPHVRGALVFVSLPVAGVGDHPRMCGEHQLCERPHVQQLGIIPACAGSTSRMASPAVYSVGSSPHVRGARSLRVRVAAQLGIIPACAGSTEHATGVISWFEGSSPHVRGAQYVRVCRSKRRGIIPACAGSTRCHGGGQASCGDHPRMCGEHTHNGNSYTSRQGSSPHVRGAPYAAGARPPQTWDHPRMCGEHFTAPNSCPAEKGSSPHVRGARRDSTRPRWPPGIIPACAGSTISS